MGEAVVLNRGGEFTGHDEGITIGRISYHAAVGCITNVEVEVQRKLLEARGGHFYLEVIIVFYTQSKVYRVVLTVGSELNSLHPAIVTQLHTCSRRRTGKLAAYHTQVGSVQRIINIFPFTFVGGNQRFQIDRAARFGTIQKIPAGNQAVENRHFAFFDLSEYFDSVDGSAFKETVTF